MGEKNSAGRPEVQSFVGAMHGQATQGVFITSGSFTSGGSTLKILAAICP